VIGPCTRFFNPSISSSAAGPCARQARRSIAAALPLLLAALWPAAVHSLPEDADQPIHIRADRAQVDRNAQTIVYSGSVQVDQGTMRVNADEMIIEYEDQRVVRITAQGQPAKYQQELEEDQGGQVRADARTIVYNLQQEQLQLQGEAFLTQGGNEITGELIRYDIVAGRVDAEAGDEGPVRVTVQPATRSD
jgi:lipopolysaccharide export system protein LptA